MARRRFFPILFFCFASALLSAWARGASASPEAHILRIDPRAGMQNGKPVLTSVIEVVQFKRLSDVLQPCAGVAASATLGCWSEQLEKPGALWDPFPFPEQNAHLFVKVTGEDQLTKFADKTQWGAAQKQNTPNVGTAWLVSIDAANSMGSRFGDARAIAHEFIEQMQPNDLMDVMFFDDVQVVRDTGWKTYKQRADLGNALNEFKATSPSHGTNRALFGEIKSMTQTAFKALGNSDQPDVIPLHQAMVVLSNGAGRGDAESASPSADVFHQYLNQGRFPSDNTSLPKTPLPVISIWLPNAAGLMENIYRNNEAQFMQALANPEIGGFFDIVQEGLGAPKSKTIVGLVRARFNAMWLVHWTVSCMNTSVEQTFNLVFENTHPNIAPDGTFKDVPIGIDPTQWPLDVDIAKTTQEAQASPLYPGGQFTVYGDFCWAGDKQRAEAYFIPAGTKPNPQQTSSRDPAVAQKAMQQLQAQHMLGTSTAAGDAYVTFTVPDDDKVLDGSGDNLVARVVIYDNKAHRASSIDEKTVLTLKATKKPLSWILVGGIVGLGLVIILLVLVLVRSGGGGRRRGGGMTPPQAPLPPGGYGAPPGGGYGAPPLGGGGYGMHQQAADPFASTAAVGMGPGAPPPLSPPRSAHDDPALAGALGLSQLRCPACGMMTMASPGRPSVCFSCGQPLPADASKGGGGGFAPGFPGQGEPVAPVVAAPPTPTGAVLRSAQAQFSVREGAEVRVGRDPLQCPIFLAEPRVSAVHASLKFEGGQLLVRDETSNNGTWIYGGRLSPGAWTGVPPGATLRFGPVEFAVQFEA
ncbi:MAG: FHA domain-containing protein [Polyangiaceae bacterium]